MDPSEILEIIGRLDIRVVTSPVRPVEKIFQTSKKRQKSAGLLNYFHQLQTVVSKKMLGFLLFAQFFTVL
jgi:hypothetical protein